MSFKGSSGKKYSLGESIGGGGEGTVHRIIGDDSVVAKKYNSKIDLGEKKEKIEAMVSMSSSKGLEYTTWPKDILYDNKNKFCGFVMNIVPDHKKINEIYETTSGITYNWGSKVAIAYNLCTVVDSVHRIGQCCGDFNPNNICVDVSKGSVYLIDTDSFHITTRDKTFRCGVGMPQYLPKEIQDRMSVGLGSMELPTFTQDTDDFALAIHIFQLLMNGCHPFTLSKARANDSVAVPQMDENIRSGRSAFFGTDPKFDVPMYAPELGVLPEYIVSLFKRAFVDSYSKGPSARPKASEWMPALLKLSKDTVICKTDASHVYYRNAKYCPWCDVEKKLKGVVSGGHITPVRRNRNVIGTTTVIGDVTYRFDNGFATVIGCNQRADGDIEIRDRISANGTAYEVKGIDDRAFADCRYINSVKIPDTVEFIGDAAFYHCYKLDDIDLPDNLERIGDNAFWWCKRLDSVHIPESVRHIGEGAFAFSNCSVDVDDDNEYYTSECGVLYTKDKDTLLCVPMGMEQYELPASVETIGKNALSSNEDTFVSTGNNKNFTCIDGSLYDRDCRILIHAYNSDSIRIPDTVERIGEHAMHGCGFPSVDIPKGLKEIGPHAFWGCGRIAHLDLPEGLRSIELGAFYRCTSLDDVIISTTMRKIESNTFWGCSSLMHISIPDSIGYIGHDAFTSCGRLYAVSVPTRAKIENDAFDRTRVVRR